MKMPQDMLFLLRGGHLNVEERKAKGLWPNERLAYSEVLHHLMSVIEQEEWFPKKMSNHKEGHAVYEGIFIQRVSPRQFICHGQRASVHNPGLVAQDSTKEFTNAKDAAEFYLKWELHLPGRLDSWVVE
jgi:hypothetical protein